MGSPSLLACLSVFLLTPAAAAQFDDLAALRARSIGPAGMSGRVTALEGVESDPTTLYVGTATGGLYKTTDAALTWTPLWDTQPVPSIGDVAIYQPHPAIVWVGTGEANPRNSSSVGNGVYRTQDGGRTWAHLGLAGTEKISRVVVHPANPDVAYVGALGTSWGTSAERGVYRTRDGGATWQLVLHVDERTGCADLVMDPSNSNKLVAALWEHRRWPWSFESGGPGSGLWVTMDGGDTWTRRGHADGLPEGELGRIGLGFCRSQPNVLYALVEAEQNQFLRSDDGGLTFRTMSSGDAVGSRPFYYSDIRVDPLDADRVYSLESLVLYTTDAGKSWSTLAGWDAVHPDHHAMWIDPGDPRHLVEGNDGGLAVSRDHGKTWRFARNLPLAQYYHISVDMDEPYNVYGGMQDNGSWRGPSTVWENGGIRNHHWDEVGFGDGFATIPLPGSTSEGYAMSQGGALFRWNNVTGERKAIRPPAPDGVEDELRFNWNAGIAVDPFDANGVYYGSQFVHASRDRGDSWEVISPDLTTDNPKWQEQSQSGGLTPDVTAAENYCSILTIAPSALEQGLVWVGTDDGRLHVTHDGGRSWDSCEERLLEVPRNTWIPHVEAGKHDAQTAYAVLDDHRRANWEPYVYRTRDAGVNWERLDTSNVEGYVHVIEEDPVDANLLFLGTEFGLWISRDCGDSWHRWTHGVPTTPVRALLVHPRDHDLVIGTFGRAAFILDDIRPLRDQGPEARAAAVHVVDIPPCVQYRVKQTGASRFPGHDEFRGAARERGALISFFVKEREDLPEHAFVTIEDASGAPVRRLETRAQAGLTRVVWNLRHTGFRGGESERHSLDLPGGPEVAPGTYTARVAVGGDEASRTFVVRPDPRVDVPQADRVAKFDALMSAGRLSSAYGRATERIDRLRSDVAAIRERAERGQDPDASPGTEHPRKPLLDALEALKEKLDAVDGELRRPADAKGIVDRDNVGSLVGGIGWTLGSSWDAPTPADLATIAMAEEALEEQLEALNAILADDVPRVRSMAHDAGIELLGDAGAITIE
jgi:photosystem II stability/assembly factor-like uncharacterized protein